MNWTMTREAAAHAIFEHMDAAARFGNESVNLVACEILLLASQANDPDGCGGSIRPNPSNHKLIMDIINERGGVRGHQAAVPFLMKLSK